MCVGVCVCVCVCMCVGVGGWVYVGVGVILVLRTSLGCCFIHRKWRPSVGLSTRLCIHHSSVLVLLSQILDL